MIFHRCSLQVFCGGSMGVVKVSDIESYSYILLRISAWVWSNAQWQNLVSHHLGDLGGTLMLTSQHLIRGNNKNKMIIYKRWLIYSNNRSCTTGLFSRILSPIARQFIRFPHSYFGQCSSWTNGLNQVFLLRSNQFSCSFFSFPFFSLLFFLSLIPFFLLTPTLSCLIPESI